MPGGAAGGLLGGKDAPEGRMLRGKDAQQSRGHEEHPPLAAALPD